MPTGGIVCEIFELAGICSRNIVCGIFRLTEIWSRNIASNRSLKQIPARNTARNPARNTAKKTDYE